MTLEELFAMPKGITLKGYTDLLHKRDLCEKRLSKWQEEIYHWEDVFDMFPDDQGSERWNKWLKKLERAKKNYTKAKADLDEILRSIMA